MAFSRAVARKPGRIGEIERMPRGGVDLTTGLADKLVANWSKRKAFCIRTWTAG
jgi:hypothetical protein